MFDRNKIIEQLINDDIDFAECNEGFLFDTLMHGFKGYENFTDDQLKLIAIERDMIDELLEKTQS